MLDQALKYYYDNVLALDLSRQTGIRLAAELDTARKRLATLDNELVNAKMVNDRLRHQVYNNDARVTVAELEALKAGRVVPLFNDMPTTAAVTEISAHAARLMELKYRQLKAQVQMVKAELRDKRDSSAYLDAMKLIAEIPRLRHITSSIWDDGTVSSALEADIQQLLDRVPWLRQMHEQTSEDIALFDEGSSRTHQVPQAWDAERDVRDGGTGHKPGHEKVWMFGPGEPPELVKPPEQFSRNVSSYEDLLKAQQERKEWDDKERDDE